jgi:hypothetical protein
VKQAKTSTFDRLDKCGSRVWMVFQVGDLTPDQNMKRTIASLALVAALSASLASAQNTYQAILSDLNETPVNASPGSGFGTVVLNAAQDSITVDLSFSGLVAAATAGHIHGPAGLGTNAAVLFPFSGAWLNQWS